MTRRIAVAAALAVLTVLVGGRWLATRHAPTPSAAPAAAVGAAGSPAPAPAPAPGAGSLGSAPAGSGSARTTPPATTSPRPEGVRAKVGPFGSRRMSGSKAVALTFDDGPHPEWTPRVLDVLRAAKVKATFCLVGSEVRRVHGSFGAYLRDGLGITDAVVAALRAQLLE